MLHSATGNPDAISSPIGNTTATYINKFPDKLVMDKDMACQKRAVFVVGTRGQAANSNQGCLQILMLPK
jgi:hypothetical protein